MAKGGNSAFSPANGSSRDDVGTSAEKLIPAGQPNATAKVKQRKAFGGKPGALMDSIEGGWEKQGHMVQPLPDGFSYRGSLANMRRDEFQLSSDDNFDPAQAQMPRVKIIK